ncbi:Clp protease ClpP [Weissella ceti]|uniref:ATP-dependent Clp protease proteolytic subunit n=1 Tax=Weissella ceti TaxID=759620 RepID=A0ABT3E4V3_9LACO|nr:head maturation protease, ClpP-related [Weissella ceti]MCW0953252.1 Clp protease ClpP [Weissella ceti]QVK12768.1 Clp protease ClpP [Weissella ceti]
MIEIKGTIASEETAEYMRADASQKTATTPQDVREALANEDSDTVEINLNSGGGEVFAGSEIYNLLRSSDKEIHINITGFAGSAASVIACAGDVVKMSPVSYFMIHNAYGSANDDALNVVNEGILNAYVLRTGLDREKLRTMMQDETYISAGEAIKLGFANALMYEEDDAQMVAQVKGEGMPEETKTDVEVKTEEVDMAEILAFLKKIDGRLDDIEKAMETEETEEEATPEKEEQPTAPVENELSNEEIVNAVMEKLFA